MLKLKGQTESGEWVEFWVHDIICLDEVWCIVWKANSDSDDDIFYKRYNIKTSTIQPVTDPRKAMLEEIRERVKNLEEIEDWYKATCGAKDIMKILDEMEAKL